MTIKNKYEIGDIVYLIVDEESCAQMITAVIARKGLIQYEISGPAGQIVVNEFELIDSKTF